MKKKLVWGIILFFVFAALLTVFIIFLPSLIDALQKDSGNIIVFIVSAAAILGAGFASNRLIASYREDKEGKKGVVCTIFYILSFIPFGVAVAIVGIFIAIFLFVKKLIMEAPSTSSSSSSENTTYEIKDERGYLQELKYDKYTKTYRDSYGNHYQTKDDGKTFTRK